MKKLVTLLLMIVAWAGRAATGDIVGVDIPPDGRFVRVFIQDYDVGYESKMGLATNGYITTTNAITLRHLEPGFDETQAGVYIPIEQVATVHARQAYPNNALKRSYRVPPDLVVEYAIERTIYADAVGLEVDVRGNFYSNNAAAIAWPATNRSLVPNPRALMKWETRPRYLTGSTLTLTVSAAHHSAMLGRPVRAVQYWGVGGTSGTISATNTVTTPTTNSYYVGTIDLSGMTQGENVTVHCNVIPWTGQILSTASGSPIINAGWDVAPLSFVCNRLGTFGLVIACVATNGTASGVAVTNWAGTTNGTMVPFATYAQALNAAGATNNTFNGNNSYDNVYILTTNYPQLFWGTGTITARNSSRTWTFITKWPHLETTNCSMYTTSFGDSQKGQNTLSLAFDSVNFLWTNNVSFSAQGYRDMLFQNCLVSSNALQNGALFGDNTNTWVVNCDWLDTRAPGLLNTSGRVNSSVRLYYNRFWAFSPGNSTAMNPHHAIKNRFMPRARSQYYFKNDQVPNERDTFIWGYNEMYNHDDTTYALQINLQTNLFIGGAVICNVVEGVFMGNGFGLDISYSQRDNEYMTNLIIWHNTIAGVTHPPFDFGFTNVTRVGFFNVNNLYADYEYRGDVMTTTNWGTNTSEVLYSINGSGNAMYDLTVNYGPPQNFALSTPYENGFNGIGSFYWGTNQGVIGFVENRGYNSPRTNGLGKYILGPFTTAKNAFARRWVISSDLEDQPVGSNSVAGAYQGRHYANMVTGSTRTGITNATGVKTDTSIK